MKISKEVRIGLLVAVSILIFFIGFNFLKNASLFSNNKQYYCYYTNIDGLLNSASVQISGLTVGRVSAMTLEPGRGVKVTITVGKAVHIPVGTVASIESPDLLGTDVIMLHPGPGPEDLPIGSVLEGKVEGSVVENVATELTPRLKEIKGTINLFDTALGGMNNMVNAQNQREISEALHSINNSAKNIEQLTALLSRESVEITAILQNVKSVTGNLAGQKDTINQVLANANKAFRQLSNAQLDKTIAEFHTAITQAKEAIAKINNGEGSLGLLINDKGLYYNLNRSLKSLDSLETDINAHPSRYINVTIFGSSKKKN